MSRSDKTEEAAHRERMRSRAKEILEEKRRLASAAGEGGNSTSQRSSDSDQVASDADQVSSREDQSASDADQGRSAADQRASDRDQAAADRDLPIDPTAAQLDAYERSKAERLRGTEERDAATLARLRTAVERDYRTAERDATADKRDAIARDRDQHAEELDAEASRAASALGPRVDETIQRALDAAAMARQNAAADRARAASDRERAAHDRATAAEERELARRDLHAAHVDELTGAYRRGLGELLVQHEIERAVRSGVPLVVAFIDVDHLKAVNDRKGFAAGDELLQSVAIALTSSLRPYDPLVRIGGDEFVCVLSDTNVEQARLRLEGINDSLVDGSFTVGLAEVCSGDNLVTLLERSNAELRRSRSSPDP